jgi:hypothetical protein
MHPRSPSSRPATPALPDLRQRKPGEVLDAAIKIWGANLKKLSIIAAVIVAPFQMIGAVALQLIKPSIYDEVKRVQELAAEKKSGYVSLHVTARMTIGVGIDLLLASFGWVLLIAAMATFVSSLYGSNPDGSSSIGARSMSIVGRGDPLQYIRATLRRSHIIGATHAATLLVTALVGIAIAIPLGVLTQLGGASGFAVLAAWLAALGMWITYLTLHSANPATMIEHAGFLSTLRRSWYLSKKRRRHILGTAALLMLATLIPAAILSTLVQSILRALGDNNTAFDVVWLGVAKTIATALTTPISAVGAVMVYFNLRLHKGETIEFDGPRLGDSALDRST